MRGVLYARSLLLALHFFAHATGGVAQAAGQKKLRPCASCLLYPFYLGALCEAREYEPIQQGRGSYREDIFL